MFLRYSDAEWSWLRTASVDWRELRTSYITTVKLLHASARTDVVSAKELFSFGASSYNYDYSAANDVVYFRASAVLVEPVYTLDLLSFRDNSLFRDVHVALDTISIQSRETVHDSFVVFDSSRVYPQLVFKDSVRLNENFQAGGDFYMLVDNMVYAFSPLKFDIDRGTEGDVAGATDVVWLRIRPLVSAYFGGPTFGGSSFGGKFS